MLHDSIISSENWNFGTKIPTALLPHCSYGDQGSMIFLSLSLTVVTVPRVPRSSAPCILKYAGNYTLRSEGFSCWVSEQDLGRALGWKPQQSGGSPSVCWKRRVRADLDQCRYCNDIARDSNPDYRYIMHVIHNYFQIQVHIQVVSELFP